MATTITVRVDDKASAALAALGKDLRSDQLMKRCGRGIETVLREHFKQRNLSSSSDSKRGQKGWPQYGIWNHIRQSTNFVGVSGNTATVSIAEPAFRAKLFGLHGAKAVNHVYLAIPLDARVYGKSARGKPVSGMFPITIKRTGKKYLAIKDGNGIKVLYRLMLSVNVLRDGRALPEAAAVQAEMTKVISRFLSANRGEA